MKNCRALRFSGWLALPLLLAGCGGNEPKVVPVKGKATRNGQPVPLVVVNFVPENGRPSWGQTDQNGEFELHYDRDNKGALTGKHMVYVEFRPGGPLEESVPREQRETPKERKAILEKYGDRNAPAIEVTIDKKNQFVEIKLDD